MVDYSTVIYILEIIGTVAFASSGAMVGIRKNMDIFGVMVLGVTTAVGGGCIRDLILGIHPPKMFHDFSYVGAAIATSCVLFVIFYLQKQLLDSQFVELYEKAMNAFDAIGLGIFTVIGIQTAMSVLKDVNIFLFIFVGVITGIGGGVMRDVMTGSMPFVFIKHVYACASIIGAILYIFLNKHINDATAMMISVTVVIGIRFLAAHYRWNLPRVSCGD